VLRRLTVTTHVVTVCIRFGCHVTTRHDDSTQRHSLLDERQHTSSFVVVYCQVSPSPFISHNHPVSPLRQRHQRPPPRTIVTQRRTTTKRIGKRRGLASGENDERRLVRRFFHDIMARAVRQSPPLPLFLSLIQHPGAMLQTVANDERRTDLFVVRRYCPFFFVATNLSYSTASFRPLNLVATSPTAAWQPNDERRLVVCRLSFILCRLACIYVVQFFPEYMKAESRPVSTLPCIYF
jgi:hypothetical protein